MVEKENKTKAFKEAAARQREKIKGLRATDLETFEPLVHMDEERIDVLP